MNNFYLAILTMTLAAPVMAQNVFKSVDETGTVTYSSSVPVDAVESEPMKLAPPPPTAATEEARAKADETVEAAGQLSAEDETRKAEKAAETQAKNEAVVAAEQNLEDAKIIRDGDWQNLQGGGRVLNEGYQQRVREAEAVVQGAKRKAGKTP